MTHFIEINHALYRRLVDLGLPIAKQGDDGVAVFDGLWPPLLIARPASNAHAVIAAARAVVEAWAQWGEHAVMRTNGERQRVHNALDALSAAVAELDKADRPSASAERSEE